MTHPFAALEDFGTALPRDTRRPADSEERHLASFEEGYRAGWDDAVAASETDTRRIGADLAQTLLDLDFTYCEARRDILDRIEPLIRTCIAHLFPANAHVALAGLLTEELSRLAGQATDARPVIRAAPGTVGRLESLDEPGLEPARFVSDDTLAENQALLELGDRETLVDLSDAAGRIDAALDAYFSEARMTAPGKGAAAQEGAIAHG